MEIYKSSDKDKTRTFESRVQDAYLTYCIQRHKYPHIIGVSEWHITFRDPILETRLDKTLGPSDFWLGEI